MTLHERIRRNRRQVKSGIAVAAAIAIGIAILRIANLEHRDPGEVVGSVALGAALGMPAVFAWLSLDRRPSLLPAAAFAGVVSALLSSILVVLWIYPLYVWFRAWGDRPVAAAVPLSSRLGQIGLAVAVMASFLVLFVHVDPSCRQTLSDGSTVEVDAGERGFDSGWTFGLGTTSSSSSSGVLSGDVVAETCDSDRIVLGEALASLAMVSGVTAVAWRWPQGTMAGQSEDAVA